MRGPSATHRATRFCRRSPKQWVTSSSTPSCFPALESVLRPTDLSGIGSHASSRRTLALACALLGGRWLGVARRRVYAGDFLGSGWMLLALVPLFFMPTMRSRAVVLLLTLMLRQHRGVGQGAGRPRAPLVTSLAGFGSSPSSCRPIRLFRADTLRGSFTVAAFISRSPRRAGIALAGLATAIALSRDTLGVHYPSDVVAGAVVGLLLGWVGAGVACRVSSSQHGGRPVGQCRFAALARFTGGRAVPSMRQIFTHWLENLEQGALS